jgi:polysaccharide pyruvyl transferase WcaK-like protein
LWADNDSPNLGVRVLARGTAELVRGAWPDAEITYQNYGSHRPQLPIGRVRSLLIERMFGRRGMQDWFRGFDVIVDTRSGDSFTDAYGLQRLTVMTVVGELAAQSGVPVILGPQTVGPFATRRGRALARATLRSARAILTRDSSSAALVGSLGERSATSTTDVVFMLPIPRVAKSRDVILNVSGLLWEPNPHVGSALYRSTVESIALSLLALGRRITLLAHVVQSDNPDSDISATNQLRDRLAESGDIGAAVEVVVPRDLDEARAVLASARVVIGSRMHACLNAISVGVPAVPLAYSDKFGPLLADLNWDIGVDLRHDPHPTATALGELLRAEHADMLAVVAHARGARLAAELALARVRLRDARR